MQPAEDKKVKNQPSLNFTDFNSMASPACICPKQQATSRSRASFADDHMDTIVYKKMPNGWKKLQKMEKMRTGMKKHWLDALIVDLFEDDKLLKN